MCKDIINPEASILTSRLFKIGAYNLLRKCITSFIETKNSRKNYSKALVSEINLSFCSFCRLNDAYGGRPVITYRDLDAPREGDEY